MNRRTVLLFAGCCGLAACAVWFGATQSTRHAPTEAYAAGARDTVLDSAAIWWTRAAKCLHADTTLPAGLRVFVGPKCPIQWQAISEKGEQSGGCAYPPHFVWLREGHIDAGILAHEIGHLKLWGWTHPTDVFGADGQHPRCGLAPA